MMEKELDPFLLDNAEVIFRLIDAFKDCQKRFWQKLHSEVQAIHEDVLGTTFVTHIDEEEENWETASYKTSWVFDKGLNGETDPVHDRAMCFCFPHTFPRQAVENEFREMVGLESEDYAYAIIYAAPLSIHMGELQTVRDIVSDLAAKMPNWELFPSGRRRAPNIFWGLRSPVILQPASIANAVRTDDFSEALLPYQRAVEDFARVAPDIDAVVGKIRTLQASKAT